MKSWGPRQDLTKVVKAEASKDEEEGLIWEAISAHDGDEGLLIEVLSRSRTVAYGVAV